MKKIFGTFLLFSCVFILFSSQALSLDSSQLSASEMAQIEKNAQEIYDSTMSPFCPGRTISACPSPDAKDLREQIKAWFIQGYSLRAVKNQLRTIYGEDVVGEPSKQGFALLAWLLPASFLVLGLCLIFMLLYRRRSFARPIIADASQEFKSSALLDELQESAKARLRT